MTSTTLPILLAAIESVHRVFPDPRPGERRVIPLPTEQGMPLIELMFDGSDWHPLEEIEIRRFAAI